MSEVTRENFERAKKFCQFDTRYAPVLPSVQDIIMAHQEDITNAFYAELAKDEIAVKIVEGRMEKLKITHGIWMKELFDGAYGDAYFEQRYKIGEVHVKAKIPPYFVEVVTSFLRRAFADVLIKSRPEAIPATLAILDLDALIIIGAYHEDRMLRMSEVTGMNQNLLERLMSFG